MPGIFGTRGVWSCGFDFFGTGTSQITSGGVFDLVSNVGNTTCSSAFARFAGKGVQCGGALFLQRTLNVNLVTTIAGFAFLTPGISGSGPGGFFAFRDATAGDYQAGLAYKTDGSLQFYNTNVLNNISLPTGLVGPPSAPGIIVPNKWAFIEILGTINTSASGQLIVNVDGKQVLIFNGNTQKTANAWCSQIYWGEGAGSGGNHQFDDLYLLDTTAPAPLNTFLGPGRIQTDGPNADSATAGLNSWSFTTPQGSDFANAANIPPVTAQNNFDGTVNDRMSFRFPSLPATTSKVFFLNSWFSSRIDAAGSRSMIEVYRSNNVDQNGDNTVTTTSTTDAYANQASVIDPNTGLTWANGVVSAVNAAEIGLKVTA